MLEYRVKPSTLGTMSGTALDWLLEENQPCVRYLTLTQLLGRSEKDPDVLSAKKMIPQMGWARDILSKQEPGGWWVGEKSLYRPKYTATNWMLLILADLGLSRTDPRIAKACDLWMERFAKKDGGFAIEDMRKSELCLVGNTARALVLLGYEEHPNVTSAFEWLVKNQKPNGGWHCWGRNGVLDAWEGMSAFAVYPRQKWTRSMKSSVERGAEFYLEREMHKQGARYGPWYRFHYPVHYYYDLLAGLDFITRLGYAGDRRLGFAVSLLRDKRGAGGKWNLDAIHPDLEGSYAKWYEKRPPTPFALETPGEPSKMITLRALQVLNRLSNPV
jgi:hypothetical protein